MGSTPPPVIAWTQPGLFPQEILEVICRVGVVRSSEHAQLQLEVHDRGSGELVAMRSWPSIDARKPETLLALIDEFLPTLIRDACSPFG